MKNSIENSIKQSLEGFEMPYNADAWSKMSKKLDAHSPAGSTSMSESIGTGAGAGAAASGIDSILKESLTNVEMPYNPAAWDAMRGQLDAKMPVKSIGSKFKWIIAAAGLAGIVVASFLMPSDEYKKKEVVNNTLTGVVSDDSEDMNNNVTSESESNSLTSGNTNNNTAEQNSNSNAQPIISSETSTESIQGSIDENTGSEANNSQGNNSVAEPTNSETSPHTPITHVDQNSRLVIPEIVELCSGESFTVENTNASPLLILGPDLRFLIPANESRTVRTKKSGIHTIGSLDSESSRNEFMVKDAPNADFLIDPSTKFENGLPTTKVESTVTGTDFEWIFNNQRVNGQTADAHFYTKGNHNVTLTVTGSNGCKTTITKSVFIEEHYNLMAMNSFRPNSTDPSTNRFMPYALLERDTRFTMIIIDPTDGHIIYTTSDASQGWNGNDSKTGRPVDFETSYIWKVTIENTATNEIRNEYSGHVIPVHSTN